MSVHVTSWVLRHSPARLSDRLVLLSLADYANEDGGGAFPSQETLAFETITTDRNVRRSLTRMEAAGWIAREGLSPAGTVIWRIVMDPDKWSDPYTFRTRTFDAAPRTSETEVGEDLSDDPSVNPPLEPPEKEVLQKIFDYWVEKSGRDSKRTKFTPGRKAKVKARLKDGYTPREICTAINGCLGSDFHVEKGFTDLTLICRSGEKLEEFIGKAKPATDERYTFEAIRDARQVMSSSERHDAQDAGEYPFDARAEQIVEGHS